MLLLPFAPAASASSAKRITVACADLTTILAQGVYDLTTAAGHARRRCSGHVLRGGTTGVYSDEAPSLTGHVVVGAATTGLKSNGTGHVLRNRLYKPRFFGNAAIGNGLYGLFAGMGAKGTVENTANKNGENGTVRPVSVLSPVTPRF